jgi:RNA polymerase sigma-70 factor (ECF subfamily)
VTAQAAPSANFPFNNPAALPVSTSGGANACPARQASGEPAVDRETFDRLVLEHLPAAQRFAIRLTGDANEAEDLLHDALVRVARKWMTFRGESSFRTWLFQVIVNAFRDRIRAKGSDRDEIARRQRLPGAGENERRYDPSREAEDRELGEIVAREVGRLPPRQREVVVLSAYEQLSNAEIATVLAVSEQNVRTTLCLARERLRTRLVKYMDLSHER